METEWRRYPEEKPPMDPEEDYGFADGTFRKSVEVLIVKQWNGLAPRQYIARLNQDAEFPETWELQGRDGYLIEGVTHWRLLPPMPQD
jgi:hypothetical protein